MRSQDKRVIYEPVEDDSGIMVLPTRRELELAAEREGYVVVDCFGTERPFNKSLLATGILATGADTPDAYRVAHSVQDYLFDHHINRIDSADLVVLTGERIAELLSKQTADLYLTWNRAKLTGRPLVVAFAGTTGIGKSTLATQLAIRLGINQVVTTNATREILRTTVPPTVLPELHLSVLEAIDSRVAYSRQAHAVTAACAAVARRSVADRKPLLIEGAQLFPGEVSKALRSEPTNPVIIERVLYLNDSKLDERHRAGREAGNTVASASDPLRDRAAAKELQTVLRELASQAGVRTFDISSSRDVTRQIVSDYIEQAAS